MTNALAVVDIRQRQGDGDPPLGLKRHALPYNALDVSDKDGAIDIRTGRSTACTCRMRSPAYKVGRATYYVTANEGTTAATPVETKRKSATSAVSKTSTSHPRSAAAGSNCLDRLAARLEKTDGGTDKDRLGRVSISTIAMASTKTASSTGCMYMAAVLSASGTRGRQVYDSGSQFERITAELAPGHSTRPTMTTTASTTAATTRAREPEAIAIGEIDGRSYAFIGLERVSAGSRYDISNPRHPEHVFYINYRDFGRRRRRHRRRHGRRPWVPRVWSSSLRTRVPSPACRCSHWPRRSAAPPLCTGLLPAAATATATMVTTGNGTAGDHRD